MQHIVINPRGTNGSGKSHIVFELLRRFGKIPLREGDGTIWAYRLLCKPPLYILGRYETPTGGCDGIKTPDLVCVGVRKLAKKGNVLFEGLLISHTSKRYLDLASSMPECKFIFGILDTPLEKCIKRVLRRRKERGNTKPFDPYKSLEPKYKVQFRNKELLEQGGADVRWLPHKQAVETILKWLKER